MKRIRAILISCLSLPFFSQLASGYTERSVDVTEQVQGMLVIPDGTANRAVLILHGFNDSMDGVGDLQKQLAHALADEDIGSLRINFRGEGARNQNVITSTRETRLADGGAAHAFLRKQFPAAALGINGRSLGGSTAILLIGTHPEWFQSTVLWSSAGSNSTDQLSQARDPERNALVRKILTEGKAVQKTWTDITITREFFVSWIGFESADYLPNYPGAFLGIRGTEDFLPLHEPEWMKLLPGSPKAYHVLGEADHIFNVLEPGQSQGDKVLTLTVDWFRDTL